MLFHLSLPHANLFLDSEDLILQNFGQELVLRGEEFVLHIKEGGELLSLPSSSFLRKLVAKENAILCRYLREGMEVDVVYSIERGIFVKRIEANFASPTFLEWVEVEARSPLNANVAFGGEGLPYFINDSFFFGLEFPAADHHFENGAFSLREHPFALLTHYESAPLGIGLKEEGRSLEETFRHYIASNAINSNAPFRYVYGNWGLYDNMTPGDPKLSEELALRSVEDLKKLEDASGVKFDQYVMDAFWFAPGSHYLKLDSPALPHGFAPLQEALKEDQVDLGLWFDINFREDHPSDFTFEDNLLGAGTYCLACPKAFEAMKEAILLHVKKEHLKALKIDFAYFACANPNHDHAQGEVPSKERSIKNFLSLVKEVKEVDPELVFYCYNGFTFNLDSIARVDKKDAPVVSPYWSWYVDYVYCGDPRMDEIPTEQDEKSLAGYTDSMIRNFYDSYFPLSSIDDHGTMIGHTGTIYYLDKATYRRSILLGFMRGERKMHLYGDLSLLDASDAKYLGFLASLQKEADSKKWESGLLLGDPRDEEVYGYSRGLEEEGLLVLVNPSEDGSSPLLSLPSWKGKRIELETLVFNGERSSDKKVVYGQTTFDLKGGDYLLLRYQVLEDESRSEHFVLNPNEEKTWMAEEEGRLSIRFSTLEGRPIRSLKGVPEAIQIITSGKRNEKERWSGTSWCNLFLRNGETMKMENHGEEALHIELIWRKQA